MDFSLDMSLNWAEFTMGLGKPSDFTYYTSNIFVQMKPNQLSATDNMMHIFDIYTWTLLGVSLISVTLALYVIKYLENKV